MSVNVEVMVKAAQKEVGRFDFSTYERIPSPQSDDGWVRREPLSVEQMAKIANVPVEMVSRWVRHGQVDPLKHASAQPVQLPDLEKAREAAKQSMPFVPRWALQPAEHVWLTYLVRPSGLRRLLSLEHRREMQNLDRGMPVNYLGPGDPVKDELVADMKHAMDRGDSAVDAALNKVNPRVHDERAAKREAATARG